MPVTVEGSPEVRAQVAELKTLSFLRWGEGDADSIAPSLWAGRGGKARAHDGADAHGIDAPAIDAGEPGAPATPSPANGGGPFTA